MKLEEDKFYVSVTSRNVSTRIEEHKHGFMAAKWTRKYKPLQILDKKNLGLMTFEQAEKHETRVTIKYMGKYGVNNVRGGLLTYDGQYKLRLGRYFKEEDFDSLKTVALLMAIIIILVSVWYLK